MNDDYLRAVDRHLAGSSHLSDPDRRRALDALRAQLDELAEAGLDPSTALGAPAGYARTLIDALADDEPPADEARWRVLGLPVETRGPLDARVRSRTWDPTNPHVVVPRLLGLGWTLNLGALAVRLRLVRPDDATADVLDAVPAATLRAAQVAPLVVAGATAAALAGTWRSLPATVAAGFGAGGRPRGQASRRSLLATLALGVAPALWAARGAPLAEDRLVRSAQATSLAVLSASVVAATVLQARDPRGRWGLVVPAAFPVAVAASLAVVVLPLRAGLRVVWRSATPDGAAGTQREDRR